MPKGFVPSTAWKPGQSGNPKGGKRILPPELQSEVQRNKAAVKQLILTYFNLTEAQIGERQRNPEIPFIEKILGQCFEKTANDGDVLKFRMLLEIVFGKIPEVPDAFELSPEEKQLVMVYRKRIEDDERRQALESGEPNDPGVPDQAADEKT